MFFVKLLGLSLVCLTMGQDFDKLFETWNGVTTSSVTSSASTTAAGMDREQHNSSTSQTDFNNNNNNTAPGNISR